MLFQLPIMAYCNKKDQIWLSTPLASIVERPKAKLQIKLYYNGARVKMFNMPHPPAVPI